MTCCVQFYDPKSRTVYTPNTNKTSSMQESEVSFEGKALTKEYRARFNAERDAGGRFARSRFKAPEDMGNSFEDLGEFKGGGASSSSPKKLTNENIRGRIEENGELFSIQSVNISESKFTQYALNFEKQPDKADAFKLALGYDLNNYQKLIDNINNNVNIDNFKRKNENDFGILYQQIMRLTGENGKQANVCTGWIFNKKNPEITLTSAYVTKKKEGQ